MKRWTYTWLHLPTGRRGIHQTSTEMRGRDFLEKLAWWNRAMPDVWHYWRGDGENHP